MHRIEDVIGRGMCVGCGACSVATGGKIPVTIGRYGVFQANLEGVSEGSVRAGGKVCPFSDESKSEDEISRDVFPDNLQASEVLGSYQGVYAGRLSSDTILQGSSSGGLTSWTARQLLDKGLVDGVIHVGASGSEASGLFSYQVSYSDDELLNKRKSAYYSTSFAEAVKAIRGDGRTYAFVGVPCFVRAARLLCDGDPVLTEQLSFFLGLVCGHLKSAAFAESLAWQSGVAPHELESVDFRIKSPDRSSKDYDFGAKKAGARELLTQPTQTLVGGNWGHGMFQLNACNFCDDIFAETADVAFGDAWLPEYESVSVGTNIVVTRNGACIS
jgi:coenzyme F420 hydrogenase subunit beta